MEERVNTILNDHISAKDLQEATVKYNLASKEDNLTPQVRFQYALALTRSRLHCDHLRAVTLLEDLSSTGEPDAFRDYLFYLVIANMKLKVYVLFTCCSLLILSSLFPIQDYSRAHDCVKKFLSVEPNNRQAQDLNEYIEKKLFNKEMKGLALVGTAAVVAGTAIALLFRKS